MAIPSVHILLVDDDADDRMLFKEAASELGIMINVSEVHDGSNLIESLETIERLPDVLVMDINMPGLSGLDALTLMREDKRFTNIPVVLMTTSADPSMIREGEARGADRYVIKPGGFKELKRAVILVAREWQTFRSQPVSGGFVLNTMLKKSPDHDSIL